MKLKEMRACADETLAFFVQTMPDVPFGADNITIAFAANKDFVGCYKDLCQRYAPERLRALQDHHFEQLENGTFGNAIIGREQSAAVIRIDYKINRDTLRRIVFHEIMHIYCAKAEMDGEHFIDVYGSGHTPDLNPDDVEYDGEVSAGYAVWAEFVAEYHAMINTATQKHYFSDIAEYIFDLLHEVIIGDNGAKYVFSMVSAYILSCADADEVLEGMNGISDGSAKGDAMAAALQNVLGFLHEQVRNERPCKITEEFIHTLGCKYIWFLMQNTFYLTSE